MGVLELVDRFRLGRNGSKTVQVQALSPIYCIAIKKNYFFSVKNKVKPSYNFDSGLRVNRKPWDIYVYKASSDYMAF
jgi:hypothetical protein